jgi:hypothetical protein
VSWFIDDSNIEQNPLRPTFLVYGDSGDGKTTLLGEYAEYVFRRARERGDPKCKTRLYTADPGGWESIRPYVRLGIIDVVNLVSMPKPMEWVKHVTTGLLPLGSNIDGTPAWGRDRARDDTTALYAFEGMKAFADLMMQFAADEATYGRNIGGEPPAFRYTAGNEGVKWAGNSRSHYGAIQTVMNIAIQESFRLNGEVWWSSMAKRASDQDTTQQILGPEVAGKGLTSDLPRLFTYTFRAMAIAGDELKGSKAEHRLYIEDYSDMGAPGAKSLGNSRIPLDAAPIDPFITPASVVKALEAINKGGVEALDKIRARVAAVLGPVSA